MTQLETRDEWINRNKQMLHRRGVFIDDAQFEVCYDELRQTKWPMPEYIDRMLLSSQLWEHIFMEEDAITPCVKIDWVEESCRLALVNDEANKWTPQLDALGSLSRNDKMAIHQMLTDSQFYNLPPPDHILVSRFLKGETFSPTMEPYRLQMVENARLASSSVAMSSK